MQKLPVPPHGHDFNQQVEHCIGCSKGKIEQEFNGHEGSIRDISSAKVHEWSWDGGSRYDAKSWHYNCMRWVQCLRLVATPSNKEITVYKFPRRKRGRDVEEELPEQPPTVVRKGTYGSYCYRDFS